MSKATQLSRLEVLLLPECLDDYVSADNPVRVLDRYIETLDLADLGFDLPDGNGAGRPVEYRPHALLKILVYGYLNQIRSSRKLEKQTKINLEVIWLTERAQPDHWTINNFRKKNSSAFKEVLRNFHKVCDVLNLFGKELLAGDGSFFKALNNKARNFTESKLDKIEAKIDAAIEAYDEALDEKAEDESSPAAEVKSEAEQAPEPETETELKLDSESEAEGSSAVEPVKVKNLRAVGTLEELQAKKERVGQLREQARAGESGQVSLSDPDSRLLKKGNQNVVGHNVQCGVDGKNTLIATIGIAQAGNDSNQLEGLARETCEALGIKPDEKNPVNFVADAGYENHGQMSQLENDDIRPHVPAKTKTAVKTPGYETDIDFRHDAASDEFVCPQGERLPRHTDNERKGIVYRIYYNTAACRECPVREQCTKGKFRKLHISEHKELAEKVAERGGEGT